VDGILHIMPIMIESTYRLFTSVSVLLKLRIHGSISTNLQPNCSNIVVEYINRERLTEKWSSMLQLIVEDELLTVMTHRLRLFFENKWRHTLLTFMKSSVSTKFMGERLFDESHVSVFH
jgi:hypothetical protein